MYVFIVLISSIFRGQISNITHRHTHARIQHTHRRDDYKSNESTEVQTLGVIRIQLIYSINVLSKYSSLISHRPSIFEGRHIDHRSSKVDTSITDLRRSTHRSSKVNTSISEGRHVTSIFESRHIYLRKSTHRRSKAETSHLQFVVGYCPQLRSYISSWSRPWINDRLSMSRRSYTRSYLMCVYKNK